MTHTSRDENDKKKKQILVNALIIKVCKCGNLSGSSQPIVENVSDNCVTKVAKVLEAL
ncbi:MAG: hypothetical protein DDT21_00696 [Syntrophomonadaceae bacterium]|nr:hypothetical protein [Bacillota bacterium]